MGSFGQLVRQLGAGTLLSVLQRSDCSAVYCEESLGTHSQAIGPLTAHSYIAFTLSGHEGEGTFSSRDERVAYMFRSHGVSRSDAKRYAKAFLRYAPPRKYSGDFFLKGGILAAARADLQQPDFVRAATNAALGRTPGASGLGDGLRFDVVDTDLGIYVVNNIDFGLMNRRRAVMLPPEEPLTEAHLLSNILDARADMSLAAFYGGDFVSSDATSAIVQVRYAEILRRRYLNGSDLDTFHHVTLPDYPSLRECIDSGQRSFKDFLLLLEGAMRFKEWLKAATVDEGLLRNYMAAVSKEGWIQSVPAKTARYLFTTALESQFPVVGMAAAVADNFIVEKLLGGWRPNHFVDSRLAPFLATGR